jgi:Ca2+-binding RTX toxin-like protein
MMTKSVDFPLISERLDFADGESEISKISLEQDASTNAVSISSVTVGNTLSSLASSWNISVSQLIAGTSINTSVMQGQMLDIPDRFDNSGSGSNETIRGDSTNNYIQGFGGYDYLLGGYGNDTLDGGADDDFLEGGAGTDVMTGGAGSDRFIFTEHDRLAPSAGYDRVNDFDHAAGEKLVFSQIDANTAASGNQAFRFIKDVGFSKTPGELRYYHAGGNTVVVADTNGDGASDFKVFLPGERTMYASDFIL